MLLKICHMTQTNMISFKQTHANETNSYNKTDAIHNTSWTNIQIQLFLENNILLNFK